MSTPTKEKGRLPGRPQQSRPAKAEIVTGEGIPLSGKHKKILADAQKTVNEALRLGWRINSNVVNNERHAFAANLAALTRIFTRARKLNRAIATVAKQANREVTR